MRKGGAPVGENQSAGGWGVPEEGGLAVDLPSGVVTFMMTDIEGSTRLWADAPDAMRAALARHDAIAADVIAGHAGFLIKPRGEGDSTFSVFARATDAVHAACALQTALTAEPWPEGAPLRVRIAVHTGEADLGVDDYYGIAVNRCARLRSIAHGGQVLVSESTAGLVRELLPEEVTLRDLGFQRLRDLAEPERVSQVNHPSLPTDFPAPRTIDLVPNNLPHQVSAFIGREAEMERIKELLRGTRLLTLTGAGGVGKTRLALQASAEMLYEYPDGVWLVELASLSDGGLLHQALATVLDVREEPGRALADAVVSHLREKQALILLDNCEHLVEACAQLAEHMTKQCPATRILATSREALRADGETVWRVPSLSVPHPEPGIRPQPEQLTQYAAVRLFIDRATKADPGFTITSGNAPAVAEICARLDGIPLAVELAAARANSLTLQQIEQRLDQRFQLLTGGRRTALPRQQTLEATVAWSHELLSEAEKLLFSRLSVFAGGFTLEGAEAVCSGDGIGATDTADIMGELIAKSLVIPGKGRYWMLETLREYGRHRLEQAGDTEARRRLHAGFYASLAEEAGVGLQGPEQSAWLSRLDTEHANLRAALEWSLDREPETGARLAASACGFWQVRGYWSEARSWLDKYAAIEDAVPTGLRSTLMSSSGSLAWRQGDYREASALCEAGLALAREAGDPERTARALRALATVARELRDRPRAVSLLQESLQLARAVGDPGPIATTLSALACAYGDVGSATAARASQEEALAIARPLGNRQLTSTIAGNLAICLSQDGEYSAARRLHEECLAAQRELGDRGGVAWSLHNLGCVATDQGELGAARRLYEESLRISDDIKLLLTLGIRCSLAHLAFVEGDLPSARDALEDVILGTRAHGDSLTAARALGSLARVAGAEGRHDLSVELARAGVEAVRDADRPEVSAGALHVLGAVALDAGQESVADQALRESLALALQGGWRLPVVDDLEGLAALARSRGGHANAARLMGTADRQRREMGTPALADSKNRREQTLSGLREALGQEALERALAEGEAMTLEEAVALALGDDGGASATT